MLEQVRRQLACRRAISLLASADGAGPATFGLCSAAIVLPPLLLEAANRADLRLVLLHEVMHVRRWDLLTGWLAAIVTAIHWFNPLAWVAKARLYQDRELACDAAVLAQLAAADARTYGQLLLRAAESARLGEVLPATAGIWGWHEQSLLHRRIRMAVGYRNPGWWSTLLAAAAVGTLAVVGLTDARSDPADDGGANAPRVAQADQPAEAKSGEQKSSGVKPAAAEPAPEEADWRKVATDARASVLKKLSEATRSNYEKIRTWKGSFSIKSVSKFPASFVGLQESAGPLNREDDAIVDFAIDMASGNIYRDQRTNSMRVFHTKTREEISTQGLAPHDARSILTQEAFVEFQPAEPPVSYSNLPDVPALRKKHFAERHPAAEGRRPGASNVTTDPNTWFGFDPVDRFWVSLDNVAKFITPEFEKENGERVTVEEAAGADGTWYRLRIRLNKPPRETMWTTVFSPSAGLNPISDVLAAENKTLDPGGREYRWTWKRVDGIFVPATISQAVVELDGTLNHSYQIELQACELNRPLDAGQFDYAGLGLKDGYVVRDFINKAAYVIASGKPVKVADFIPTKVADFTEPH